MKFWHYVETHHEDWGIALFIIPVLLAGLAIAGVCYGVSWLFR